ncbi:CsgG/HfaB family protein [Limnobacter sp.]|uniref:CsgG/HfaB family protein n=1 Tax=Limnobacter sp. TaxID=2003368 RepID=UPI0035153AD6
MLPTSIPPKALLAALACLSSACTTLPSFNEADYVTAFDGASVVENKTRYSRSLECVRPMLGQSPGGAKRFAVGRVSDFTGKEDLTNGKRITQGAALMVISALAKAGVPMVERFDPSIADMELKYSDNKLITDEPGSNAHRRIFSGSLPGSDFHIVGGITEVNYNIRSGSVESSIRFIGAAARYFVMNVAVDLRVVNTKTLEVVNVQSLQKQIIGTELNGGYFRLFSDGLVDVASAERTQEPIQKAVRMVIEQAVFNMVTEMNQLPAQRCAQLALTPGQAEAQATHVSKAARTVNSNSANAAQSTPTSRTTTSNPVVLTPPPTNNGSSGGNDILIDPYTGEIITQQEQADAVAASQSEVGPLKGLFGTANPQAPANSTSPEAASNNRQMQEKLLWGTRPMLR